MFALDEVGRDFVCDEAPKAKWHQTRNFPELVPIQTASVVFTTAQ
jgi:hypothetical protein